MSDELIRVAALAPFWRYSVGPEGGSAPAIPFYRRAAAERFFLQVVRELPFAVTRLYKRRGFSGIEVVKSYTPKTACAHCGCRHFVFFIPEQSKFSGPTHGCFFMPKMEDTARCHHCNLPWKAEVPK